MKTITLQELVEASDAWTDEFIIDEFIYNYANQCVAHINTEVGLNLPEFTDAKAEYSALPVKWTRRLLTPYLSWSIKMNDGSLTEADVYWQQFIIALMDFSNKAIGDEDDGSGGIVDVEYIDQTELGSRVAQIDFRGMINKGWKGMW